MRNRKKKCKGKHEIEVLTSELGEKNREMESSVYLSRRK